MTGITDKRPADDFSNEVFDAAGQAERDHLKTLSRQGLEAMIVSLVAQDLNFVKISDLKEGRSFPKTIVASNGNWKGELDCTLTPTGEKLVWESVRYRITRSNGQSGGNKCNINCSLVSAPSYAGDTIHSPDSMWSDGVWHNWYVKLVITPHPFDTVVASGATFIFDQAGNDPRAEGVVFYP